MMIGCLGVESTAVAARKVPKLNTDSYAVYDKPEAIEDKDAELLSETTNDRKGDIKGIFKKYDDNFDELINRCLAKMASSDWKKFDKFVSNIFFDDLVKELNAQFYVKLKVPTVFTKKDLLDFVESRRAIKDSDGNYGALFAPYLDLLETMGTVKVDDEFIIKVIKTGKYELFDDIRSYVKGCAETKRREMEATCDRTMREIYKKTREK